MKNFILHPKKLGLLFTAAALLFFTACNKTDDDDQVVEGSATIKLVNAFQGSQDQDFFQDGTKLTTSPVAYGSAGTTVTASTKYSRHAFAVTGSTTASASIDVALAANGSYTVFYHKRSDGTGQVIGYENNATAAASGKAKVRFINLGALLTSTVSVAYSGSTALVTALELRAASAYQDINPGVDLNATATGSLGGAVIPGSNFQAGKIYTVWFDAATTTTVNFHILQDN